jgi:hypothetical protein
MSALCTNEQTKKWHKNMNVMINVVKNSQNRHILVPLVLLLWLLKQAKKRYFLKKFVRDAICQKMGQFT